MTLSRVWVVALIASTLVVASFAADAKPASAKASAAESEMTLSQLNVKAAEGQAAVVHIGSGEHMYDMGVKDTGFFISHAGQDTLSIDNSGFVTVRSEVLTVESISAETLALGGVNQWQLSALELFNGDPTKRGWFVGDTKSPLMNCSGLIILVGPTGSQKVPNTDSISKTYEGLPPHNQARIQATAHFIDDWQGETAYMKIGNSIVWTDAHDQRASRGNFNVCGMKYPDSKFSVPIDITIPHTGAQLKVSFGSTLDNTAMANFGISSLSVSLRSKPVKQPKASVKGAAGKSGGAGAAKPPATGKKL